MAISPGVLGGAPLDVVELDRVAARIKGREPGRSFDHAEQLVDVLVLHRTFGRAPAERVTPATTVGR